jgi:hypothetical protein
LDKNKHGYINLQTVQDFMKRSDLSEEILNRIITICKIQNGRFYPNDFFIALRLVALAQNNFPFTEQEIINNNPIPSLPEFKEPNKYPQFNPDNFIDIYKIYEFLKKFEENMNNKFEKLSNRIEEINKRNKEENKKIITLLSNIYEKEKKTIKQSNNNIIGNNRKKVVIIKNSNNNVNKIDIPLQKIIKRRVCHSPDPNNENFNFKTLPNNDINNGKEKEKEKALNDKKLQYYTKKVRENKNLILTNENILTWNNNRNLLNPKNFNNNLTGKGQTNKNITPFDEEKKK